MTAGKPQPIYLKDYTPAPYRIPNIELQVDLFESHASVRSRLTVSRLEGAADDAPLVLNGERLVLVSVRVSGRELGPGDYQVSDEYLRLSNLPRDFVLQIETRIEPQNNFALEGLYKSGNIFCTQNESEGFRKITYFLDRPNILSVYSCTVSAERDRYPVLLSNGNLIKTGSQDNGRHFAVWHDPFPKPCYLFALVAGDLGVAEGEYRTRSGSAVSLRLYVEKGNEGKCGFALESLKNAMRWDEEVFGLDYDLDIYMIVAVHDFNFGAMENKGLNIFNARYILADPATATDQDYQAIESVVGHEYFHNWTGNRVTCRDWFQITLKEGLTIFRDQEFSSDRNSRSVKRISDVRILRDFQFVEDAGPNAHPIRPASYIEINNFYTVTVYQKGAEVIRMVYMLLGHDLFVSGIRKYFELYDGKAVTTEDFIRAMELVSGRDLSQFQNWYHQAGAPVCRVHTSFEEARGVYELTVEQLPPDKSGGAGLKPYYFPLAVGLLDRNGKAWPLEFEGDGSGPINLKPPKGLPPHTAILHITKPRHVFRFKNIKEHPIPSLLRNFSAPVHLQYHYTNEELLFLFSHDTDPFNRYEAGQRLATISLNGMIRCFQNKTVMTADPDVVKAFGVLAAEDELDPAFRAETLVLPSVVSLVERMKVCDFQAAFAARESMSEQIALANEAVFSRIYHALNQNLNPQDIGSAQMGKRALKNQCLAYLSAANKPVLMDIVKEQFEAAAGMTDEIAALVLLCQREGPLKSSALEKFYKKWRDNKLVMNKWLAVIASAKYGNVLFAVREAEKSSAFDRKNPNNVRALYGAYGQNLAQFHQADGSGYVFMAEKIIEVDAFNPSLAANLSASFKKYPKLDERRKPLMEVQVRRILARKALSRDVFEILSKTLGTAQKEMSPV